jgi:hypothetical protein
MYDSYFSYLKNALLILRTGERNSFFIPDYLARQDKESYDSDASHAEKAFFFFKDKESFLISIAIF